MQRAARPPADAPHLQRDWATPPTSAAGLGSPLPHLRRDWAQPCPHLHRDSPALQTLHVLLNGTSWYDRVHKLRSVRHALLKYHRRAHYCDVLAQPQIGPKGLPRYLYVSRVYQQVAPATSAPGLGLTAATSAPGLGLALLPHLHRDLAHPVPHLH